MSEARKHLKYCADRWGYTIKGMPPGSRVPFAIFKPGMQFNGFAMSFELDEPKSSRNGFFEICSVALHDILEMSLFHNTPCVIVVKWRDSLAWWKWEPGDHYMGYDVHWGSWNGSQQVVVRIPVDKFHEVRKT